MTCLWLNVLFVKLNDRRGVTFSPITSASESGGWGSWTVNCVRTDCDGRTQYELTYRFLGQIKKSILLLNAASKPYLGMY